MAGECFTMVGWSLTEVSVLGRQVFGQELMVTCAWGGLGYCFPYSFDK